MISGWLNAVIATLGSWGAWGIAVGMALESTNIGVWAWRHRWKTISPKALQANPTGEPTLPRHRQGSGNRGT
ncbi:MAG: hypothetical protein H5U04_06790 [Firmicutes bacterium]|nr:hypothetical protein [Bacillota bacterium]